MLGAGLAASAAGPLLLRFGWGGSRSVVAAGWAAMAIAIVLLGPRYGAWGLAMGATTVMLAALAVLAHAWAVSPAPRAGAVRRERATARPLPLAGRRVGRRVLIFLIVVPLTLAATSLLGWAAQRAVFRAGWSEANALALALLLIPALWTLVASWQMTCTRTRTMAAAPALCAALGGILWLAT